MIDGKKVFRSVSKNDKVTYWNIKNLSSGHGDDCTIGYLLEYTYFKKYYKMIAIDLSKQQVLDADPKATQETNFTENLDTPGRTRIFFILEEAKETILDFHKEL